MQTNTTKKTNFFERIMQIADFYGYKNTNDFAKNALHYKSPEKINRLKDSAKKPSVDILIDIANKFEEIDIRWLLTGDGNMLSNIPFQNQKDNSIGTISNDNYQSTLNLIVKLSAENALLKKKISDNINKGFHNYAAEPGPDEV